MRHRPAASHHRGVLSSTLHTPPLPGGDTRDAVVTVDGLTKSYGATTVLDDVSFSVGPGELFGLLGTNGAGKTTLAEILQGLRRASAGGARVLGLDPATAGDRLRRRIGAQLQDAGLPTRLRVGEALELFAGLHQAPRRIDELAEEWDLGRLWSRPFAKLSGGEQQRLFVALALLGRPELVFLDEMTQNLDPAGRRHTWEVIRQIRAQGTTVFLVTHDVEEAERLCDHVVVLSRGRVIADGSPEAVVASTVERSAVWFTDIDLDARLLRDLPGVEAVRRHGPRVEVTGRGPLLAHVGARLVALDRPPIDLEHRRPSLEDAFVELTDPAQEAS